ncbi:MAG: patatin [Ectothiorhodospiraceae bacterium]|nr:patatin [Ectothiorhodospiraceae bacterium]
MNYPFKNLVFEQGGTKGLAYLGAFEVLDEMEVTRQIERVGGSSFGAMYALLIGLGYSTSEIKSLIRGLSFTSFMDKSWASIFDVNSLVTEFGWYDGDFLRSWVANIIKQKTGNSEATFKELHEQRDSKGFIDQYYISTNISTGHSELFSIEHTPRLPVADAVRLTMSIPFIFAAKQNIRGDYYTDGALTGNSLVKVFDREKYIAEEMRDRHMLRTDYYDTHNASLKSSGREISPYVYNVETLGFRLGTSKRVATFRDQSEYPNVRIDDFFGFTWSIIEMMIEGQSNYHIHNDDWHRTVFIDTMGVKSMQFDLDDRTADALIASGKEYASRYFKWYNDAEYFAWNTDKLAGPLNKPSIDESEETE